MTDLVAKARKIVELDEQLEAAKLELMTDLAADKPETIIEGVTPLVDATEDDYASNGVDDAFA